jgi:hypothetical protein
VYYSLATPPINDEPELFWYGFLTY